MNSQWRWETVVSSPGARDERSASVDEEMERLSARHLDVLGLIADGLANKEIAIALGITPSTAKGYVEDILLGESCIPSARRTAKR